MDRKGNRKDKINNYDSDLNPSARLVVINNSMDDLTQIKDLTSFKSNSLKRGGHRRSSSSRLDLEGQSSSRSRLQDQDLDDTASVCSSSNSEHSVGTSSSRRRSRKGRRRCPVHEEDSSIFDSIPDLSKSSNHGGSQSNLQSSNLQSSQSNLQSAGSQSNLHSKSRHKCTCKTLKPHGDKTMRGAKRPEPEGGVPSESYKGSHPCGGTSDELDGLIWSNEPIFSDLEETDNPVLEAQIKEESDRLHRRTDSALGTDGLFSAAQSLNSSTIIKLAITGNELKNVKDASLRRAEGDVTYLSRRLHHIDQGFTQAEKNLNTATEHLNNAISLYTDYNRDELLKQLEERQQLSVAGGSASSRMTAAGAVHSCYSRTTAKVTELFDALPGDWNPCIKYHISDLDQEMSESRLEACEWKVQELEDELRVLTSAGKIKNTTSTNTEHSELIQRLSLQLAEAERMAHEAERFAMNYELEFKRIQDETACDKKKHQPISARLQCSFSDLSSY